MIWYVYVWDYHATGHHLSSSSSAGPARHKRVGIQAADGVLVLCAGQYLVILGRLLASYDALE